MSTLAYAVLTDRRKKSPEGTSFKAFAEVEPPAEAGQPGAGMWIDVLAALVPAEVLAAHAFLIGFTTKTEKGPDGKDVTTITEPTTLKWIFVGLVVTSLLLYVIGHVGSWDVWDWLRMLIAPVAFVAWTMLQKSTAFDAVAPDWSIATRSAVAVIVALIFGALARRLAYKADEEPAA